MCTDQIDGNSFVPKSHHHAHTRKEGNIEHVLSTLSTLHEDEREELLTSAVLASRPSRVRLTTSSVDVHAASTRLTLEPRTPPPCCSRRALTTALTTAA